MRRPLAAPLLLVTFLLAAPLWATCARATTARDLSPRFSDPNGIDGFTHEWTDDERLFGATAKGLEEPTDDSKWGVSNDISQVRVTWDAHNLYLAGEGKIWNNNLVIWVDALPGRGMTTMSGLNSWARNFTFSNDFAPDLFGATWDNNPTPHLVLHQSGTQVVDNQVGGGLFRAASTFSQDRDDRAMEFAIPWSVVFANDPETRDTVVTVDGKTDTLRWFPPGQRRLKICAAITAGGDNTGGANGGNDNTGGGAIDLNGKWDDNGRAVCITQTGTSVSARYLEPYVCDHRDGTGQTSETDFDFDATLADRTLTGQTTVCKFGAGNPAGVGLGQADMTLTVSAQ
jgi:hypothetical protein